jgi:hypothetical protein
VLRLSWDRRPADPSRWPTRACGGGAVALAGGCNGRGMVLQAPGDGVRSPGHLDMNAGDFPKKNWNGM